MRKLYKKLPNPTLITEYNMYSLSFSIKTFRNLYIFNVMQLLYAIIYLLLNNANGKINYIVAVNSEYISIYYT